tara:strand:- start:101 stop:382 length:282 start_codon:yes stop_codon:yes gene_type:complete
MTNNVSNTFCKITGRVQGVGFRAWSKKMAKTYNLKGWVKNCPDESVELEISGEETKQQKFIKDCERGPIFSKVIKVESIERPYKKFDGFEILY